MSHAKLSASSSARWLSCPGSVRLSECYENKTSSAAQEGTTAHGVGERLLLSGEVCASPYVGQIIDGGEVTEDMVDHVNDYVLYCRSLVNDDSLTLVEQRVDYSNYVPEGFGTADFICVTGSHVDVVDFKYGQGVQVDAFENTQGQLYALGVINELDWLDDIKTVTLHIHQPRKNNISSWETTSESLHKFGEYAARQADIAINGVPERNLHPTEKGCQWCQHAANCLTLQKLTTETVMCEFENMDELPEPTPLDKVVAVAPLIRKWLDKVEAKVLEEAMEGKKFDAVKLIHGRSSTTIPEEKIVEVLGEQAYTKKIIGVTAVKKLLGAKRYREDVEQHAIKRPGKLKVVGRDEKGKEVESIADDFEDIS